MSTRFSSTISMSLPFYKLNKPLIKILRVRRYRMYLKKIERRIGLMFEMFYCIHTQTDSKVLVNLKCSFSI